MSTLASSSGIPIEEPFDEFSIASLSMQPSDEWESDNFNNRKTVNIISEYEVSLAEDDTNIISHSIAESSTLHQEEQSTRTTKTDSTSTTRFSKQSVMMERSYASNHSFIKYLRNLVPTKKNYSSCSPDTYTKPQSSPEQKLKTEKSGSLHSRCIIENTESIKERRDDHKERRKRREGDNCARDQSQNHHDSVMSCSVEEISQISELTMDFPTVVTETKFAPCTTLPTISEVKRFESPQIAACTEGVKHKVQCSDQPSKCNKNGGNGNDIIDFVFELVEDAFCVPMTRSKAEQKKLFKEAFREESRKTVEGTRKKNSIDPFRTARKHNKNNTGKKIHRGSPGLISASTINIAKSSTDSMKAVVKSSPPTESMYEEVDRVFMVDNNPDQNPRLILPTTNASVDEEQTLDWSKIMSFAEKQLEANDDEKLSIAKDSNKSVMSSTKKSSSSQSTRGDNFNENTIIGATIASSSEKKAVVDTAIVSVTETEEKVSSSQELDQDSDHSASSSFLSNSCSTHDTVASKAVRELRELSALDSSSFEEEETSRFLLTSLLFRFVRDIIPGHDLGKNSVVQEQEQVLDEASENCSIQEKEEKALSKNSQLLIGPQEEFSDERIVFKALRYIVFTQRIIFQAIHYILFIVLFVFWPSGIPRRKVNNPPLKRKTEEPSLLKLVCETDG